MKYSEKFYLLRATYDVAGSLVREEDRCRPTIAVSRMCVRATGIGIANKFNCVKFHLESSIDLLRDSIFCIYKFYILVFCSLK